MVLFHIFTIGGERIGQSGKTFAAICIIMILTLFATIGGVIYAKQAEYKVLKDEIVTVVDKEYKAAYTTSGLRPMMIGKTMTMQPYVIHHDEEFIIYAKLDNGKDIEINSFKLAYDTVKPGKRYKWIDLIRKW